MPDAIGDVPLHPLVVHLLVALIPLAAIGVFLIAIVPKWRTRFGSLVFIAALIAAGLTPVATQSGENLSDVVRESDVLKRHEDLGQTVLWGVIPLAVVSLLLWWIGARDERGRSVPHWLSFSIALIGVIVAVGAMVQIVLVGHSGAKAVWVG
jgi:uncharacterized membrane protein